jgi:hypothetical protein
LQIVAEPSMASQIPPAPFAHARIDDWTRAQAWIAARFADNVPALPIEGMI